MIAYRPRYFEKDGVSKPFLYDPRTNRYKSVDTNLMFTPEELEDMGYVFVNPSTIEKESIIVKLQSSYAAMHDESALARGNKA